MRRIGFKIGLFVCVWYEVGRQLGLDGDSAFVVTAIVWVGGWLALRMAGQLAGMLGPLTAALVVRLPIWLVVVWCVAPPVFATQPVVFKVVAFGLMAFLGARGRHVFEQRRADFTKEWLRQHSEVVVVAVLLVLACAGACLRLNGSFWPLVYYALLPGIPLSFGWRAAVAPLRGRSDARMGNAEGFRAAGMSEEA